MTLVVNQVCTLSCKFCTSYLNRYTPESRINFSVAQVVEDVKTFFDAVDSVGTITIMGGEPFLHPDISTIVQAVLDAGNFGVISISTSGTCHFKPSQLRAMRDRRVNISFSNYLENISEKQRAIVESNIRLLQAMDIHYTIGPPGQKWLVPSTLYARERPVEQLRDAKSGCLCNGVQLKGGKIYPCDFGQSVDCLHLQNYPDSYVTLKYGDLRRRLRDFLERDHYQVCERCAYGGETVSTAGEQGFVDFLEVSE